MISWIMPQSVQKVHGSSWTNLRKLSVQRIFWGSGMLGDDFYEELEMVSTWV